MIQREQRVDLPRDIIKQSDYKAINLSGNGILIESQSLIRKGQTIELELDLNGIIQNVSGIVRWTESIHPIFDTPMRCGLEFAQSKTSDLIERRKYIASLV